MDGGNLTLTATGNNIVLGNDITLTSGAITLTGAIDASGTGNGGNHALTITAGGRITLNDNINTGTGALSLSSSFGGIALGGDIELDGAAITLTGAIDEAGETESANDALTVRATGVLTLNSDINTGTSALSLSGDTIVLGSAAVTSLTGAVVELTGALSRASGNANLTITARGVLTLNDNINIATAALSLTAGTGAIGGTADTLTAGTVSLTQADLFPATAPFTFALEVTSLTLTTAANQAVHDWMTEGPRIRALDLTTTGVLTIGGTIDTLTANLALSGGTITLDSDTFLNGANVTLTGAIDDNFRLEVLTNGVITLNDNINVQAGVLILDGTGGIVLVGDIELRGAQIRLDGAITGTSDFTVNVSNSLELNGNIDIATAALSLTVGATAFTTDVITPMLTAGTVSLTQAGEFAADEPFTFGPMVNSLILTLTTNTSQTVYGWMTSGDRALTLTAGRSIFITEDTGAGINTGTGALTLIAGTRSSARIDRFPRTDGTNDYTLTASTVSLTQSNTFFTNAQFTFNTDVLNLEVTSASSNAQEVHGWMTSGNRALSLTTAAGITINRDISTGTSNLTLNGAGGIVLMTTASLSGSNVELTGAVSQMGDDRNFSINASGNITINDNIRLKQRRHFGFDCRRWRQRRYYGQRHADSERRRN